MFKVIGFILLGLVGLLVLILLLPIYGRVRYQDGWNIWAGIGPFSLKLYPRGMTKKQRPSRRQKKAEKQAEPERDTEQEQKQSLSLSVLVSYLKLAASALGQLRRKLVVRQLQLLAVIGGQDAAKTAMRYGYAAAGVSTLLPYLEDNLRLHKTEIEINVDFQAPQSTFVFDCSISACILKLLIAGMLLFRRFRAIQQEQEIQSKKGGSSDEQYQRRNESNDGKTA